MIDSESHVDAGYSPINVKHLDRKRYNEIFDSYYEECIDYSAFSVVVDKVKEHFDQLSNCLVVVKG